MSGGVDSSVAAYLLQQQGHRVEGLFMKNWDEDDDTEYCTARADLADAQAVCDRMDIPLHTANFAADDWDNVFEHFLAEYRAGRKPNPDVLCNREIKFKAFLDYAIDLVSDFIATGHYARRQEHADGTRLLKGWDHGKDQSYFLCEVSEGCLDRSLFPVGDLHKARVRQVAESQGFVTHAKKDSTGICFIGERKFRDFLARYLPAQPGQVKSVDGEVLGEHAGLMYYTYGQRQGLGIGGIKNRPEAPWYVVDKDLESNTLLVAQGNENRYLQSRTLRAAQPHWISRHPPSLPLQCSAKIRYRQTDQACRVVPLDDGGVTVEFEAAQRAVTPGQYIVFYDSDVCLGGAIIEHFYR